jgi:hypothetical protein
MIKRFLNWPELLAAAIEERRRLPFQWGPNDCVSSASSIIAAFTGVDLMREFRGAYSSALSAARVFARHGGMEALVSRVCAENGVPACALREVRRGNLSMHLINGRLSLGVVNGAGAWAPAADGLAANPLSTAIRFWRI